MAGADIRRFSTDRHGQVLNLFGGVAAGGLGTLAETLLLPNLVLAYFVGQLASSYVVVGLVPAVGIGLWLLARVPAIVLTGPRRRQQPWAIAAALVRAAATALLATVCFRANEAAQEPLLRAFFVCYVAYSLASGFASVPISALLAKAIPPEGRLILFRQRAVWGGAMALVGGLVVARLLGGTPDFPRNYALLFLAATVCHLATAFFVATVREPVRLPAVRPVSLAASVIGARRGLADPNLRRFLGFRLLLALTAFADPFLVVFAASELGVPAGTVGAYVLALVVGRIASTPFWAALARRRGDKTVLQVAALVRLLPPMLALLVPFLRGADGILSGLREYQILVPLFGVAFVAIGAAVAGQARGNVAYLTGIAPVAARGAYAGLTNALLAVAAFAPIVGGFWLDRARYSTIFAGAGLLGLLAVFASGVLAERHVRARPVPRAARPRPAPPLAAGVATPSAGRAGGER